MIWFMRAPELTVRISQGPPSFYWNSSGTVRWVNLTENYWVRARPAQILEAAKILR